jgi:hypothetical protein
VDAVTLAAQWAAATALERRAAITVAAASMAEAVVASTEAAVVVDMPAVDTGNRTKRPRVNGLR